MLAVELICNSSLIKPETLSFAGLACPVMKAALISTTLGSGELLVRVVTDLGPLQRHVLEPPVSSP